MFMACRFFPALIFSMAALVHSGFSQDTAYLQNPPIIIKPLQGEIRLDGKSEEEAWVGATSLPFIVFEPVWGMQPTEKTELLVGYDSSFLYIAGRCYTKDSATIVARNLIRDGWRGDDWMTFHIDSRFDRQNAFVFSIYPFGSRYDLATSNDAVELGGSTLNVAFNMFWQAKTTINRNGWFFEMKIPLFNLRFKPNAKGEITMGISSTRAIQYNQEYHQFPATPRNAVDPIMKPSLKQPVVLSGIPKPRLFLLTPYSSISRSRKNALNPSQTAYEASASVKFQAGVDAKIGLSSYLTLDLSVNPDFAQVEADDQLINLSRFSLFFPERRLFFQEQAGLFEFNLGGNSQLFYSRRIGINQGQLTKIYGGLRLTGKLNDRLDVGALSMQSADTYLADSTRVPSENYSVIRLRQNFLNERSFIGGMFTNRIGVSQQNAAFGVDALVNPGGMHYLLFSAASGVYDHQESNISGWQSSRISLLWETRRTDKWHHRVGYTFSGADFNPGIGFVDRSAFQNLRATLAYGRFAKDKRGTFQYGRLTLLNADAFTSTQSGKLESLVLESGIKLRTFLGTEWNLQVQYLYEYLQNQQNFGNGISIPAGSYRFPTFSLDYAPPRFKIMRTPITISEGGFYNGRRFNAKISPAINLGSHWEIQAAYDFSYVRFKQKNIYKPIHTARMQITYALDLHFSAIAIVQYNNAVNQFFNNLRLRYNFSDGHDLYLVWNENFFTETLYSSAGKRPSSEFQHFTMKYNYTFF